MPTGYTAAVSDGTVTDLRTFALNTARAFGALISLRDEPSGKPIPTEIKPSDHHLESLREAREEREKLLLMSQQDRINAAELRYIDEVRYYDEDKAERDAIRARYQAMLAKVENYTPPTPEHTKLKEYMREQLTNSIDWDCDARKEPVRRDPDEWWDDQLTATQWTIEYHEKEHKAEVARCASATEWIQQLWESLPPE